MKTANEMRDQTIEINRESLTEELKDIEYAIEKASADGKYSVSESGYLSKEAEAQLKSLGYSVELGSQYNEGYYIISWN